MSSVRQQDWRDVRMKLTGDFEAPIGKKMYIVNTGDWRYQRPVTQEGKCRKCGVCFLFCPTGSRYQHGNSFDTDLRYCKGCGICANECAAAAIVMVEEVRK